MALGHQSGFCGFNVCDNTYLGFRSGYSGTQSDNNTFVGSCAGYNNRVDNNTFVGFCSGSSNITGNSSTYIGSNSGSVGSYSGSIAIGACAQPTANNQLVIASSQFPIGTASSGSFTYFLNVKLNGVDFKIPLYS